MSFEITLRVGLIILFSLVWSGRPRFVCGGDTCGPHQGRMRALRAHEMSCSWNAAQGVHVQACLKFEQGIGMQLGWALQSTWNLRKISILAQLQGHMQGAQHH